MDEKRLKELTKSKKMTQQKLSEILDVDISTIGKWEIHNTTPNPQIINQLADYFQVSVDYLLGRNYTPLQFENMQKNTAPKNEELSAKEKELLAYYRICDVGFQADILAYARGVSNAYAKFNLNRGENL